MSKDELPTYDELMWPTLQALKQIGGSGSNQEILDKVAEILKLPEQAQNIPHHKGPNTELNYQLAWARTYLRLFGGLENSSRGVWTITPKGESLTEPQVAGIPAWVRKEFREESRQGIERREH